MRTKNIQSSKVKFELSSVYWLCKDVTFYTEAIKILQSKNIYDHRFWSFSIFHKDEENMRIYFNSRDANLKRRVGT